MNEMDKYMHAQKTKTHCVFEGVFRGDAFYLLYGI